MENWFLHTGFQQFCFREFMFFDRGSARHLNYAIKTLGDPSFNVSYTRDYAAIALQPEIFGGPGKNLGEFHGSVT